MNNTEVIVIGAGLAGLYAASRLQELKKNYLLFDANSNVGGRVSGISAKDNKQGSFDMGPSWIFPQHLRMQTLARKFHIDLFEQFSTGDVLYQFENIKEPQRMNSRSGNHVLRVKGGTTALINKILSSLQPSSVYTDHRVTKIERLGSIWKVSIKHKNQIHIVKCLQVIIAIPPRILARDFCEEPWITPLLHQQLFSCQTWMASQAKFLVTYAQPFWREQGLSGQAFSQQGPLVEIHDACLSDDASFALFGFIGMPATQRIYESVKETKQKCIRQLGVLFGQQAFKFEACYLKDWAKEPLICTGQDQSEGSRHPIIQTSLFSEAYAEQNMFFAGSEYAEEDAGYLEGAIVAVDNAIKLLFAK